MQMEQVNNGACNQLQESKKQFFSSENSEGASLVKLPKALKGSKQSGEKFHFKAASPVDSPIEEVKFSIDGEKISFDELLKPVSKKAAKVEAKNDTDLLCDVSLKTVEPIVAFPLIHQQFESINLQLEFGDSALPIEGNKTDVDTDIDIPVIIATKDLPHSKRSVSLSVNKLLAMPSKVLPEVKKAMDVVLTVPNIKVPNPIAAKPSMDLFVKPAQQDIVQSQALSDNSNDFLSFMDSAEEEILSQTIELPLDINNKETDFLEPMVVKNAKNLSDPVESVVNNPANNLMQKTNIAPKNEAYLNLAAKIEPKIIDSAPISVPIAKDQVILAKPEQRGQQQIIPAANVSLQPAPVAPRVAAAPLPVKKTNLSQKLNGQYGEQKQDFRPAVEQAKAVPPKSFPVNNVKVNVNIKAAEPMQTSLKDISKELVKNFKAAALSKNIEKEVEQAEAKPLNPIIKQSAPVAKKTVVDLPSVQPIVRKSEHLSFAEWRPLNFSVPVEKIDGANVIEKPLANFSALVGVEVTNVRKQGDLQQIDLVLKPEHLGKLVAKLRFIDKQMLVEIQAPNKDIAKTLMLNENLLKDAIKNAGLSHKHELKLIISDKSGAANILHTKRNEVVTSAPAINPNDGLENFLGGNSDAPNSERKKFKKKAKNIELDLSAAPKRDFGRNNIEKVLSNNSDNLLII